MNKFDWLNIFEFSTISGVLCHLVFVFSGLIWIKRFIRGNNNQIIWLLVAASLWSHWETQVKSDFLHTNMMKIQITQQRSCCSACRLPRWRPSSLCFPVRTQTWTWKCFCRPPSVWHFMQDRWYKALLGLRLHKPYSGGPQRYWGQRSARSPWPCRWHRSCPRAERGDQASRSPAPKPHQRSQTVASSCRSECPHMFIVHVCAPFDSAWRCRVSSLINSVAGKDGDTVCEDITVVFAAAKQQEKTC